MIFFAVYGPSGGFLNNFSNLAKNSSRVDVFSQTGKKGTKLKKYIARKLLKIFCTIYLTLYFAEFIFGRKQSFANRFSLI